MRLPQLFVIAAAVVLAAPPGQAAPQTPYERAMSPYVAELNRQCPGRRLEDLTAGDLDLIMEGFEERLSAPQRHRVEHAIARSCADTIAGPGCRNTTTTRPFIRMCV